MSVRRIILILLLTSSFISVVITGMVWLFAELNTVKNEKILLTENSIINQKQALKNEVSQVLDYIDFKNQISTYRPNTLIQKEILTYIASIRFGNDGYVFVNTFDGNALVFDGKLINGKKDISDMTDPNGLKIFQLEMEAIQNTDGGFIDYMFKKMTDTIPQAKVSYIGSYRDWEWIIGAGDYYDNLTAKIEKIENKLLVETKSRIIKFLVTLLIISCLMFLNGVWISKKIREQNKIFSNYLQIEDKDQEQKLYNRLIIKELKDTGIELKNANLQTKQFADIIDQSLNEIYIFDSETLKFLYVNQGAELNIGYAQYELVKLSPLDLTPEIDSIEFEKLLNPLKSGKKSQIVFETFHQRKNKSMYPVEVHLQLTTFNEKSAFVSIVLDIAVRQEILQTLKESEERFRNIFEKTNAIMYIIDVEDGKLLDANSAAINFYGYTYKQFVEELFIHDLNILSKKEIKEEMELVRKGEKGYFNFKHKLKSGDFKDVEVFSGKVVLKDQDVLFSIVHDITERKKTEAELAKYQNSLEKLVKERTSEIGEKNKELIEKNKDLEKYHEHFVGREFRMKELKDEIKELKQEKSPPAGLAGKK
jgi:PAS domain S-box-containing protein